MHASDLLSFLSRQAKNLDSKNVALVSEADLPHGFVWADLIVNLQSLASTNRLEFNVKVEESVLIAEVVLPNLPDKNLTAVTQWAPSRSTVNKLLALGISYGRYKNLLNEYIDSQPEALNESDFVSFAIDGRTKSANPLVVPSNWMPGSEINTKLLDFGLPAETIQSYLENSFRGQISLAASWDDSFLEHCLKRWNYDSKNEKAIEATLMSQQWEPSENTINTLLLDTMATREELELMFIEYRLYWLERGEKRANWNSHFKHWAKRQDPALFSLK